MDSPTIRMDGNLGVSYMVFEGFFDFLSFKAIYPHVEGNAIILNSVCNLLMGLKELESLGATDIYVY